MANGDTIAEVRQLLSEKGALKQQTALRLSLALQAQIYEKQIAQDTRIDELEKETKQKIEAIRDEVKIVKNASIVLWIQNNPKLALFVATFCITLSALVDLRELLAKVLGVK